MGAPQSPTPGQPDHLGSGVAVRSHWQPRSSAVTGDQSSQPRQAEHSERGDFSLRWERTTLDKHDKTVILLGKKRHRRREPMTDL